MTESESVASLLDHDAGVSFVTCLVSNCGSVTVVSTAASLVVIVVNTNVG